MPVGADAATIVAILGTSAGDAARRWTAGAGGRMGQRDAADERHIRLDDEVVLALLPDDRAGEASWCEEAGLSVVAMASLYYRADLLRRLAAVGVHPGSNSAAALILAAYRAWGAAAAARLEGDVAFVLRDRRRRQLLAARDFVGRNPLYVATLLDGGLAVASSVGALLALESCPGELSLAAVGGVAAGLPESPWDTAYSAITALPAGHTLIVQQGNDGRVESTRLDRHWEPPTFESGGGEPIDRAAEELRHLIGEAVVQRLDDAGPTAVWLSGGWDSPTIYGAGQAALRSGHRAGSIIPVSMSYPVGDPGREDELIEQVTGFWDDRPRWCDSAPIPLFGDAWADAAVRELPFAHPYALWTRAIAGSTRAAGARVALDGSGGDQLFQLSPVYLADLLRGGRWLAARREWKARNMSGLGWRRFARYAVLPLVPRPLVRLAEVARGGRPLRGIRGWPLPPWIRADFAARYDLSARQEPVLRRRNGESHGAHETRWFFESSYSPTVLAAQSADARHHGVELRSPLLDGRVVAHAARRPRVERSDRGQTKLLLRAAARGLLPDEFLAPRPSRTGTTEGYYRARLVRELPELARRVFPLSALAELGIVEPSVFTDAVDRSIRGGDQAMDVAIFYTIQTELWLRARCRASPPGWTAFPTIESGP